MKKVAWISDDFYLQHETGAGHPESLERLESINLKIEPMLKRLIEVQPISAKVEDVRMIHSTVEEMLV